METLVKTKQVGGSLCVVIPKEIVEKERILVEDIIKIDVKKPDNLNSLWGKLKDIKKPTDKIMREIDEGEIDV